jgi:hypothetical protein
VSNGVHVAVEAGSEERARRELKKAHEKMKEGRKRESAEDRTLAMRQLRRKVEMKLERNRHWSIRLTKTRATIGETFEHARLQETLVRFRNEHPVYIALERLEELFQDNNLLGRDSEYVYTIIKQEAARYWKERAKVRHAQFKDKVEETPAQGAPRKRGRPRTAVA